MVLSEEGNYIQNYKNYRYLNNSTLFPTVVNFSATTSFAKIFYSSKQICINLVLFSQQHKHQISLIQKQLCKKQITIYLREQNSCVPLYIITLTVYVRTKIIHYLNKRFVISVQYTIYILQCTLYMEQEKAKINNEQIEYNRKLTLIEKPSSALYYKIRKYLLEIIINIFSLQYQNILSRSTPYMYNVHSNFTCSLQLGFLSLLLFYPLSFYQGFRTN